MIQRGKTVIIEESYYSKNVKTFQMLSRIGAIAYTVCHLAGVKDKKFMLATQARKFLGLQGRKKEDVHEDFKNKLKHKLEDEDAIDALILALNGILEE